MAYTLLDAAYEMYYPEAEFGLLDRGRAALSGAGRKAKSYARLANMKARKFAKGRKKDYKTGATKYAAKRWNQTGGAQLRQDPFTREAVRGLSRNKTGRSVLPRKR